LWQYNENKTLEWLTPKIEKVSKVLVAQQINVNQNAAISSSFKVCETSLQATDGKKFILYSVPRMNMSGEITMG